MQKLVELKANENMNDFYKEVNDINNNFMVLGKCDEIVCSWTGNKVPKGVKQQMVIRIQKNGNDMNDGIAVLIISAPLVQKNLSEVFELGKKAESGKDVKHQLLNLFHKYRIQNGTIF